MIMPDTSRLTRTRNPMPPSVRQALEEHRLMKAFGERPAYQQNDYLGWITRARRDDTKQRRLEQMLDELTRGNVYMRMAWRSR